MNMTYLIADSLLPGVSIPDSLNPMNFVQSAASAGFAGMAQDMAKSAGDFFTTAMTFWVSSPTGGVVSDCAPQVNGTCAAGGGSVVWLQDSLRWLGAIVAVASIMFACIKMMLQKDGKAAGDVAMAMVKYVVITGGGLWAIAMIASTMDEWSRNIIASVGGSAALGKNLFLIAQVSPGGLFLLGLFGIIVALIQIGLLLFRDFIMIFMAGALPTAAAASSTAMGKIQLDRFLKWTLAFLFYKPVAALIYALALRIMSTENPDVRTMMMGLMAMCAAVVVLPAMMKLVAPVVGAATGMGGGAMAVGGAVATGVVMTVATGGAGAPAAVAGTGAAAHQAAQGGVPQPQPSGS